MPPAPPPDDPDDDLIAYLDGELDEVAAEQVESELAHDQAARTRADEYKKTFDLLDYLPKPEPSATFATRTLTRLRPAVPASGAQASPPRRKLWPGVAAWVVVAVVAAGLGFAGHGGWRQATGAKPADLPLSDLAVIENLPLYAGADDVEFVRGLCQANLFDADPADPDLPRRDTLSAADRDRLIAQFRGFTPARQQQLRTLHQKLTDPATPDRPALLATLDAYAVWLARLPEADRRRVLDASPEERQEAVRQVREKRWRERLPQKQQEVLQKVATTDERLDLLDTYRSSEAARRQEWEYAQRQWKEMTGKDKPWPFNDPALAGQVDAYILSAFGVDPAALPVTDREKKGEVRLPPEYRLSPQEVIELRERREAAAQGGYWFTYGALLLRLSDKYPTLPRPAVGKPVVSPEQLRAKGYPMPKEPTKVRTLQGKWPEFALEVARATRDAKEAKADPLGPCKPEDFTEPVRQFVLTKLTDQDRKQLDRHLGKWPEYPQELMKLARERNLSVPEVSLPGEPDKWRQYYQLTPAKK